MVSDNKSNINFTEFQAKEKALIIGKRYLNLFHQLHVITAGLEALNKDFVSLSDDIVKILPELAGGAKFRQHIQNLKDGITPMDKIDADLLPFGEEVFEDKELFLKYTQYNRSASVNVQKKQEMPVVEERIIEKVVENNSGSFVDDNAKIIFDILRTFQNNPKELEAFKAREEVRDFGPEWKSKISDMIDSSGEIDKANLKKIFDGLCVLDYALNIWQECVALVKNPRTKTKDEILQKLSEYSKYLNMFGGAGKSLYEKVEALTK